MAGCKTLCVTWLCFVCCWTLLTIRALGQEAATVSRVPAPGPRPSLAPIAAPPWPQHALAPYIDATSWPLFDFVSAAKNQAAQFSSWICGRKLAGASDPELGGLLRGLRYRLQEINALRRLGGDVAVSLGGATALSWLVLPRRSNSYRRSINLSSMPMVRVFATLISKGCGSAILADRETLTIAAMQAAMATKGRPLEVWYTLPATPSGLTRDGIKVVQSAISYGVSLRGVNIMAMDYGDSVAPAPQGRMGTYAVDAANGLFRQLQSLYSRNGKPKLPNGMADDRGHSDDRRK